AAPGVWTRLLGGDGGAVAVDPLDNNVLYGEYYYLSIQKSTDGGATFNYAISGISATGFQFITPFVMEPNDSKVLWTGGKPMWRTKNSAGNWTRASSTLSASVSAIAVANANSNYVLAGTVLGTIYRTTKGLTTGATAWASATPRSGYLSSLAFDPNN